MHSLTVSCKAITESAPRGSPFSRASFRSAFYRKLTANASAPIREVRSRCCPDHRRSNLERLHIDCYGHRHCHPYFGYCSYRIYRDVSLRWYTRQHRRHLGVLCNRSYLPAEYPRPYFVLVQAHGRHHSGSCHRRHPRTRPQREYRPASGRQLPS